MAPKEILVGIIGVGLVGSELVSQILSIPAARNPFKIVFLSSSRKALYDTVTSPDAWKAALDASSDPADLKAVAGYLQTLVAQGSGSTQRQAVIVDNTSSDDVARLYPEWLKAGVSVVTPNKKAFSGDKAVWDAILAASAAPGAGRWLNESTVGAGLPVINTLKEMLGSGDRVKKIEGVFSGTMSYIFNEWSAATPSVNPPKFSEVVRVAREKGYTEPHPADDLNGADVARKLTILARTVSAFSIADGKGSLPELQSYEDVDTQGLIPTPLEGIKTGDEFVERLPKYDGDFERVRVQAEKEGQVLRFVGVVDVEEGVVKAGLAQYPVTHPFATSLGGSDNIIMFHTERYSPRPLIVQGSGAGAAVTAMGVLGDLLKLA
ncbi:aspartate kinase homoserine dehydrogenase [Coprinellus micaceus]|uniref:Homoserine dehydrogenase n=1 Tax=Coprinellus micaceus TaxID=71717 RepID=A0A4Y7TJD8_COPMI|nr:aspartate kinase homoserine dehydrogenase [Coprinellus micaceus]